MSTATANPYAAPDAALETASENATYDPAIIAFRGRIGRMRYLAYMFAFYLIVLVSVVIAPMISGATAGFAGGDFSAIPVPVMIMLGVLYLAIIVFWTLFGKRRLNDLNRSGWWLLLFFAPEQQIWPSVNPISQRLPLMTPNGSCASNSPPATVFLLMMRRPLRSTPT